jgi:hypothetical protein
LSGSKTGNKLSQQHYLFLINRNTIRFIKYLSIPSMSYVIFSFPCFRLIKEGILLIGPGRYKETMAMISSKRSGFNSLDTYAFRTFKLKNGRCISISE